MEAQPNKQAKQLTREDYNKHVAFMQDVAESTLSLSNKLIASNGKCQIDNCVVPVLFDGFTDSELEVCKTLISRLPLLRCPTDKVSLIIHIHEIQLQRASEFPEIIG